MIQGCHDSGFVSVIGVLGGINKGSVTYAKLFNLVFID